MTVAPMQISLPAKWAKDFQKADTKEGVALVDDATKPTTMEACGEWIQKSLWSAMVKQQIDSKLTSKTGSPTGIAPSGANLNKERIKQGAGTLSEEDMEVDWYKILDINEEEATHFTPNDLRNVFRKRCIETHPDKMPDQSDTLFKNVQKGYDILSNESTRRAYDSSRPFDDAIPPADIPAEKFYTLLAPIFERNMKFSLEVNLPNIGDADTPMKDVKKFYDAWYRFRSWRDFSSKCDDLEKIAEEMDRAEKRYLQRENQRKLDKRNKEEMARIRTLVDRAHKNDPRIIAEREAEVAAQERIKAEREAERERIREAAGREKREAAEAAKKAAADKLNKAKDEKEALKELRVSLMAFFKDNELLDPSQSNMLCDDEVKQKNINWLSQKSNAEQITKLMAEIVTKSVTADADGKIEAVLFFNECVKITEENIGQNRYGEAIKSTKQKLQEEEARLLAIEMAKPMRERKVATYDEKELLALTRGAVTIPAGEGGRIKKLNALLPDSKRFSDEQLTKKVQEIEDGWAANPKTKPIAPDMSHKARLVRHLEAYNPGKVGMADAMLEKYKGREEDWIKNLVKKFGPEPEPEWKMPA